MTNARTLIVTNARAFLPRRGYVDKVTLRCEGTRIRSIRRGGRIPSGSPVFDARGARVTPGLIDAHTHLCMKELGDGGDGSEQHDPVVPYLDVRDAINPWAAERARALFNGVTAVMVTPGSANLIGGAALMMKTAGRHLEEMILKHPAALKMALGQNPKRAHGDKGRMPSSRMTNAYLIRKAFLEARAYRQQRVRRGGTRPPPHPGHERMLAVLEGKLTVKMHCHRADDIMTALRLADEFGFRLTLDHATEAFRVLDELARRQVDCILGPSLNVFTKAETRHKGYRNPVLLRKAGLRFALTTDHSIDPCWLLPLTAGLAAREGLDPEDALRAITEWPAAITGVGDRIGSLQAGRDADFIVWEGDPLKLGRPRAVFVNGRQVQAEDYADLT